MEFKFLTPGEVSELLKVTERTVYRWIDAKELKATKLGRVWRIAEEDLQAFLNDRANK